MRPHHLLCSLTFVGEGYSAAFVANFRAILARIESGETITIVSGADDICAPLLESFDAHCVSEDISARDTATSRSLEASPELRSLLDGGIVDGSRVSALRDAFARGMIRSGCVGCSWFALCTDVARTGYAQAVLHDELGH